MIGRYEEADLSSGLSSTASYGCGCQPSYVDSWIEKKLPNGSWTQIASTAMYIGDTMELRARELDGDCGGWDTHTAAALIGSQNDPVATVNQNNNVLSAVDGGDAEVGAYWTASIWYPLYECCEFQSYDPAPTVSVKVKYPASLSLSIGSKRTHSGGPITDCDGNEAAASPTYGYSHLLTYTLKDRDGNTFAHSGYEATEEVYAVSCNPNTCGNGEKTIPVNSSSGTFCDVIAFFTNVSAPISGEYQKMKQLLNITTSGHLWAVRVNCINAQYDDVTISDSTANPNATCQ